MKIAPALIVRQCLLRGFVRLSQDIARRHPAPPPPGALRSATRSFEGGGDTFPAPETKHFKGSIGSSLDLQMKLVRTGDQLAGSYFYQKIGTRIDLRGNVDKDGNLTLDEFDPSGKQTGVVQRHLGCRCQRRNDHARG
jgi:hypothetical protein